jgi:glutathione synthase
MSHKHAAEKSHLFVVDPLGPIDITKDSSFALMLAVQKRGQRLYTCDTDGLFARSGDGFAHCRPTHVQQVPGAHFSDGPVETRPLGDFDLVWMRKDPPFDMQYIAATYVLDLAPPTTRVLSRPESLRSWNEKTSVLRFPQHAPASLLTRDMNTIRAFQQQVGGSIVVKPLAFSGGAGIVALHPGDLNSRSLLEMSTRLNREFVLVQAYLPAVVQGDKRVILVDGVARAGLLRIPPADDLRGNIHIGATVELSPLTPAEQRICDDIGPVLRNAGHLFVGIDLIGERLTEINVTSPTGIQEIRDLGGPDLAEELVDAALGTPALRSVAVA